VVDQIQQTRPAYYTTHIRTHHRADPIGLMDAPPNTTATLIGVGQVLTTRLRSSHPQATKFARGHQHQRHARASGGGALGATTLQGLPRWRRKCPCFARGAGLGLGLNVCARNMAGMALHLHRGEMKSSPSSVARRARRGGRRGRWFVKLCE
jgi:hypothetical protein